MALIILATGILLRWLHLDADPESYIWNGYITDEGRWIAHARALALFGDTDSLDWSLHLFLAPLFQAANYVVFEVFGVSMLTSRLLAATSGSAMLAMIWVALRSVASPGARLIALTLLALEADLVLLSRVAVPEIVVMFLLLAAYVAIVTSGSSGRRLVLAGLLLFLAVGMKATALPSIGIFSVIVLMDSASSRSLRKRSRRLLLVLGGLLAVPVGATFVLYDPGRVAAMWPNVNAILGFLSLSSPSEAISFFFRDPLAPVLNLWMVAMWLSVVGWIASRDGETSARSDHWFVTSAIWVALYGVLMLSLAYFPARYKVHILVPMSVNLAVGFTLLSQAGVIHGRWRPIVYEGWRRWLVLGFLALPVAVVFAPLLAAAATDGTPPRLRFQLICIGSSLAATMLLLRGYLRRRSAAPLVLFPVIAVFIWVALDRADARSVPFWPVRNVGAHVVSWVVILATSALVAIGVATAAHRLEAVGRGRLLAAATLAYLSVSLIGLAPGYLHPRYTIRDASRHLSTLLADGSGLIGTFRAESLFTENSLRYRSVALEWSSFSDLEVLVVAGNVGAMAVRDRAYRLTHQYTLYLAPAFHHTYPGRPPGREIIRVYGKVDRERK
jgi:hypothetical protein